MSWVETGVLVSAFLGVGTLGYFLGDYRATRRRDKLTELQDAQAEVERLGSIVGEIRKANRGGSGVHEKAISEYREASERLDRLKSRKR